MAAVSCQLHQQAVSCHQVARCQHCRAPQEARVVELAAHLLSNVQTPARSTHPNPLGWRQRLLHIARALLLLLLLGGVLAVVGARCNDNWSSCSRAAARCASSPLALYSCLSGFCTGRLDSGSSASASNHPDLQMPPGRRTFGGGEGVERFA